MSIPQSIHRELSTIPDYLETDEASDYLHAPPDEREGHVYESVLRICRWMRNSGPEKDYFGNCPKCQDGGHDGFLNTGRHHWFVCHIHRLRWTIGENLFSCWKQQSRQDWVDNWNLIRDYEEIPIPGNQA